MLHEDELKTRQLKTEKTVWLEAKPTIGKAALGAIAFFAKMRAGVNLAAFDTVVDDLCALRFMEMAVAPIVIEPEPKEQKESRPQIEQKKISTFSPTTACD